MTVPLSASTLRPPARYLESPAEFQNALHSKRGRRKIAVVRNSDLVVESTGHTRAFHGRAYLNSMLPSGVTEDVVQ